MARTTKHRSNYQALYRKKQSRKDEDFLENPVVVTTIVVVILYGLFTILFWLWIIGLIGSLFYWIHYLNHRFWWYNTRYYCAPVISYLVMSIITLILIAATLVQYWKIDAQLFGLAKSGSDYITIGNKSKNWSNIEIDEKWIATKVAISQIEDPNLKKAAEIPSNTIEKIMNSIHESFLNIFK